MGIGCKENGEKTLMLVALVRPLSRVDAESRVHRSVFLVTLVQWCTKQRNVWSQKWLGKLGKYVPKAVKNVTPMRWAVTMSVTVHAAVLFVNFGVPVVEKMWNDKSPIVAVLVNTQTLERPENHTYIAQVNLQAGGNVDDKVQASTITLRSEDVMVGTLEGKSKGTKAQEQLWSLEQEIQKLQTQIDKQQTQLLKKEQKNKSVPTDEESKKLQMDLAAKIEKELFAYAQRPRKKFIGTNAVASFEALWVEAWQRKVETFGNQYYPEQARGKVRGELIVTAGMRADGTLESVTIDKSSGTKVLDDAAQRILKLSAPFEPFNQQLSSNTDILYVTRLWRFGPNGIEQSALKQ